MRAGPAFLQFDWSKAGLRIFPYEDQLQIYFVRQGKYIVQLFMWLQTFYFKPRRENLTGLLFCLDLHLSRSIDHRDRNLHLLYHLFQSSRSLAYYFVFSFECKHVCF